MRKLAVVFALLVLSTGCGDKEQKAEDPIQGEEFPACAELWQVGNELPADYEGCLDGDTLVASVIDGEGNVVYDDTLQAKPGSKIEVR